MRALFDLGRVAKGLGEIPAVFSGGPQEGQRQKEYDTSCHAGQHLVGHRYRIPFDIAK